MQRAIITLMVYCLIAAGATADSTLHTQPVTGLSRATYDLTTGRLAPQPDRARFGPLIWDMTNPSGHYVASMDWYPIPDPGVAVIDLGDIIDGALVDGFEFGYATDLSQPTAIDCRIIFYADYDGYNSNHSSILAAFQLDSLPAGAGSNNGWIISVDLSSDPNAGDLSFPITGGDPDNDGMTDFGYSFWFPNLIWLDSATGPMLANPDLSVYHDVAGAEAALGVVDYYCTAFPDPNLYLDDVYWFGGWDPNDPNTSYSQFYLGLYGYVGDCSSPGASGMFCTADIDGSGDCRVGLADLATMLSQYGETGAALLGDLDIDGDVDLSDLAVLLAQYGDDCN